MWLLTFVMLLVIATVSFFLCLDTCIIKAGILIVYITVGFYGGKINRGEPVVVIIVSELGYFLCVLLLGSIAGEAAGLSGIKAILAGAIIVISGFIGFLKERKCGFNHWKHWK